MKNEEFVFVSWNWRRNHCFVEVHCRFSLFSAIWDCLYFIEALNVLLLIVYPSKFVARIIQINSENYETLRCNLLITLV
jgi:hypothetical protein